MGKDSPASALVVIDGALISDRKQLAAFQNNTAEQLQVIAQTESLNVKRRLFVGVALLVIKASLKHGEWMPWLKKHAQGASYRQCAYMMSAAQVFIREMRLAKPEIASLPVGKFAIDSRDGAPKKLAAAADKFSGELTWGELLDKHGIREAKKLGGARSSSAQDGGDTPDAEQLYLFSRDELGGWLEAGKTKLLKENLLSHLAGHPEEVQGVVAGLRDLADQVEAAAKPLLVKAS